MLSIKRKPGESVRLTVKSSDGTEQIIYFRIGRKKTRSASAIDIGIEADRNAVKIERTELCTDQVPELFRTIRNH